MQIAILLYDRFTALDAVGPYEVLSRIPGAETVFVAERSGPVTSDLGSLSLVASTWTTSVCTGSLVLAAAGLLAGRRATTHWLAVDQLPALGVTPANQRVVFDGKYVTAAGVSAGIDMAITLAGRIAGDEVAQMIQLGIEYHPEPPYRAGSPDVAPPAVVELMRGMAGEIMSGRA
jgi:putative intracellular protease/amidase